MAKIQSFSRIIVEDYDEKDRPLVTKLANSLNPFCEAIVDALTKRLTITDNFDMSKKTVTLSVDSAGVPTTKTSLKSELSSQCVGITVLRAVNTTTPTHLATGTPFVTFTDNDRLLSIVNITNLVPNDKYTLTLILHT